MPLSIINASSIVVESSNVKTKAILNQIQSTYYPVKPY